MWNVYLNLFAQDSYIDRNRVPYIASDHAPSGWRDVHKGSTGVGEIKALVGAPGIAASAVHVPWTDVVECWILCILETSCCIWSVIIYETPVAHTQPFLPCSFWRSIFGAAERLSWYAIIEICREQKFFCLYYHLFILSEDLNICKQY